MEIRKSIIFNKISSAEGIIEIQQFDELRQHVYTEDEGIGLIGFRSDDDVIELRVLVRIPTYLDDYDQDAQSVQKKIVYLYEIVVVCLDIKKNLIYSNAPAAKFNRVKNYIKKYIGIAIAFQNIQFTPVELLKWFDAEELHPSIVCMTIKNFKYNEDAIGRYSFKVFSQTVGENLLLQYGPEVRNLVLKVDPDYMSSFIVQASLQNTVSIKCEESDLLKIIELIKKQISYGRSER